MLRAARARPRAGFRPVLDEQHGPYRVRFAQDERDLQRIFKLRFEVFNVELGEGLAESAASGLDRDPFDRQCDHLMVEETATGRAVGTYRLQVGEMALAGQGFYSATEFDLECVPRAVIDDAVELGRACISKEHRNKKVLYLLWRGLAAYGLWNGRRYFFGCSSLTSQDQAAGLRAYAQLARDGHVHPELEVRVLPANTCRSDGRESEGGEIEIPPLFGTYLRYGAKVCGPPAIDRAFGTIDFLTLLDVARVPRRVFMTFAVGLEA